MAFTRGASSVVYLYLAVTVQLLWASVMRFLFLPLEKLFLTHKNLCDELDVLEARHEHLKDTASHENMPQLNISDLTDEQLDINITVENGQTSPRKKQFSESESIEVVHDREQPHLHGILKQRSRTQSESSDDVFSHCYSRENSINQTGSESPISENISESEEALSPGGRKKSVSFSEHIDQTMYKSNQSISSLHSTLKNKRKRNRKREQKQAEKCERRRHRSSGSECSSDHEFDHVEEYGVLNASPGDGRTDEVSVGMEECAQLDGSLKAGHEPLETSPQSQESGHGAAAAAPDSKYRVLSMAPATAKTKHRKRNKNRKRNWKTSSTESDGTSEGESSPAVEVTPSENDSDDGEDVSGGAATPGDVQDTDDAPPSVNDESGAALDERTSEQNGQGAKPETVLSWKENEADGTVEHKSPPAVAFSNTLMYDLDEE